jgi:ribosome production factor 1
MGQKRQREEDGGASTAAAQDAAPTIGQQTAHIRNKIVRGTKYAKLKHEKNKSKKKERARKQKEIERAEALGIEPPPKPVPKVCERGFAGCCCACSGNR